MEQIDSWFKPTAVGRVLSSLCAMCIQFPLQCKNTEVKSSLKYAVDINLNTCGSLDRLPNLQEQEQW